MYINKNDIFALPYALLLNRWPNVIYVFMLVLTRIRLKEQKKLAEKFKNCRQRENAFCVILL